MCKVTDGLDVVSALCHQGTVDSFERWRNSPPLRCSERLFIILPGDCHAKVFTRRLRAGFPGLLS